MGQHLHRLSQQQYGSLLDAYVTREHRHRRLHSAMLIFHVLSPNAFTYGIDIIPIEDVPVRVSDAARTLLDALDYPKTFGTMRAAIQLVERAIERVDTQADHRVRRARLRSSTCQRLGMLLERRGVSARQLAPLARRVSETASVLPFIPDAPSIGPINKRWRVVENDNHDLDRPYRVRRPPIMIRLPDLPDRGLLADLCSEAADVKKVQPFTVEKDFYLTRLIWALAQARGERLLLYGGTLLSKVDLGYRRMSEDVDLLIPKTDQLQKYECC